MSLRKIIFTGLAALVFFQFSFPAAAQLFSFAGSGGRGNQNRSEMSSKRVGAAAGIEALKGGGEKTGGFRSSSSGYNLGIDYQIHILGQVENPGTYRLTPSTRLDEAISKANGVLDGGSKRLVEVRRDGKTFHYDLFRFQRFGDLAQNPFLMNNDVIFVPYLGNSVSIKGTVKSSGVYELLPKEKTLDKLIPLAGGFTSGVSDKHPITVVRFDHGEKKLLKIPHIQSEMEQFELLNGDVVVVPHFFGDDREFDYNITELPGDNVYFPTQKNEVYVAGAVSAPGAYIYSPANSVRDIVIMAGPTELAKLRSVYVLTSDGRYIRSVGIKKNFRLSPGDTVVVPKRRVTTDNALKWYGTITGTIFSGFALRELLR